MELGIILVGVLAFVIGAFMGVAYGLDGKANLKRENEKLNSELTRLTDRDSRGRFTRNEKDDWRV